MADENKTDLPGPGQTKGYVTNPVDRSTTRTKATQGSGIVVGLMGFTVLFAVMGEEIAAHKTGKSGANQASTVIAGAPKILAGGVVATSLLVLVTHAGDGGRQLAIGLALVAFLTTSLVYGGPVWDAMSNAFGSKPTGSTGSTTPTTPGTNTASSAATVATNLA